jgi:hypothetical protein
MGRWPTGAARGFCPDRRALRCAGDSLCAAARRGSSAPIGRRTGNVSRDFSADPVVGSNDKDMQLKTFHLHGRLWTRSSGKPRSGRRQFSSMTKGVHLFIEEVTAPVRFSFSISIEKCNA